MIAEEYADLFFDADALWAAVQVSPGGTQGIKLDDCQAVVAGTQGTATVEPFEFFASLGLKMLYASPATLLELWLSHRDAFMPEDMPPDFSFASLKP